MSDYEEYLEAAHARRTMQNARLRDIITKRCKAKCLKLVRLDEERHNRKLAATLAPSVFYVMPGSDVLRTANWDTQAPGGMPGHREFYDRRHVTLKRHDFGVRHDGVIYEPAPPDAEKLVSLGGFSLFQHAHVYALPRAAVRALLAPEEGRWLGNIDWIERRSARPSLGAELVAEVAT